jgi:TolB protein
MRRTMALGCVLSTCLVLGAPRAEATFPGANGKIAFYVLNRDPTQILTIEPDGTDRTRLTSSTGRHCYAPAWSSDGSTIAFVSSKTGPDRLVTMNADGTGRTVVFEARRWPGLSDPAWSPDGTQIALMAYRRADGAQIAVVDVDGSGYSVIHSRAYRFAPDWSPDGTRIAFVQYGQTSVIRTMDPDGTDAVTVTEGGSPSWSPDGSHIVFAGGHHRNDVYVVADDGSGRTQLTDTRKRWEFTPVFSPDGNKIAFSRTIRQTSYSPDDIWVMDADGTDPVAITHTRDVDEVDLSWQSL